MATFPKLWLAGPSNRRVRAFTHGRVLGGQDGYAGFNGHRGRPGGQQHRL